MMLTQKERNLLNVLIIQAPSDVHAMRPWFDHPDAPFTRGIAERHQAMADWLDQLLRSNDVTSSL